MFVCCGGYQSSPDTWPVYMMVTGQQRRRVETAEAIGLHVVEAWVSHKISSTLYLMKQCMIRPNQKGI